MPRYKRKPTYKKAVYKRKTYKAKRGIARAPRTTFNTIKISREYHAAVTNSHAGSASDIWSNGVASSGPPPVYYWNGAANNMSVQLYDFPGYVNLVAVFDQYRITKIQLTFEPTQGSGGANEANIANNQTYPGGVPPGDFYDVPTLLIAYDTDGATSTPTQENDILVYPNHKKLRLDKRQTFTYTPRTNSEVYKASSGVGAYVVDPAGKWIDCNDPQASYYGCVYFMDTTSTTISGAAGVGSTLSPYFQCKIYVKAWIELRGVVH